MSASFYDLLKYAKTGIASPDMTGFDKLRAMAMAGGGKEKTLTGIPPLSFKANGKPLISWSMKGNGQQTGTPTPDVPIMPTFCGVRTGNLFDINSVGKPPFVNASGTPESNIGTLVDGVFTAKTGLYSRATYINYKTTLAQGTYAISFDAKETIVNSLMLRVMVGSESIINETIKNIPSTYTRISRTFTLESESQIIIGIMPTGNYQHSTNLDLQFKDIMINTGSTALPYEPYGWKIPITCAGQTVPIYLGQTQTVRNIKKLVLDGTESWSVTSSQSKTRAVANFTTAMELKPLSAVVSTHYVGAEGGEAYPSINTITISNNGTMIIGITSEYTDTDSFKSYLAAQYAAGTPVTVWYVLTKPTTGIVNEPLAKIGEYADELSSTDAAVTIPTAKGQNTLTVETDLQPSEMTITYK